MARKLSSLFETPGPTAHAAYLLTLVVVCTVPLVLLPLAVAALPLHRPVLWAVYAIPAGLVFIAGLVYGPIRHRVRRLLNGCDETAVLRSPCLILTRFLEQPGVAEIARDRLILVPLFGRQIEVPLREISRVRPSHWFNGAVFQSLTGFRIECSENRRKPFS